MADMLADVRADAGIASVSFTMPALEPVLKVLRYRGRPDLAALLANSSCEFDESNQYGSYLYSTLTTVEIRSALREHDRLKALTDTDSRVILDAFREINPPQAHSVELCDIRFVLDASTLEWEATKTAVDLLLTTGRKHPVDGPTTAPLGGQLTRARNEAQALIRTFRSTLGSITVLDPACGSGNFLYVTLQKLKDLEKEVVVFTRDRRFTPDLPQVDPQQFFGIEINRYAHDLAQMVVWIGYLQWIRVHGLGGWDNPVLRASNNIECRDAILEISEYGPREPQWPQADFIIGNPPFLGGKKLRSELGDEYVEAMFEVYKDRVPAESDLCCYWFEKAREQISGHPTTRAGLLATQGIRGP